MPDEIEITRETRISVQGIEPEAYRRVEAVASQAGITAAAAVVRFAFNLFASGKSIMDYETVPAQGGADDGDSQ